MEFSHLLKTVHFISVWSIVIPLGIGLVYFKKASPQLRLFIGFLLVGFTTDVSMFIIYKTADSQRLVIIITVYSLIEASVFFG